MKALIAHPCVHCGAPAGMPCVSVGKKVIVTLPHMARLRAADAYALDTRRFNDAQRQYENDAVASFFNLSIEHIPQRIIDRAKRERSIDPKRLWVKDAIAMLRNPRNHRQAEVIA